MPKGAHRGVVPVKKNTKQIFVFYIVLLFFGISNSYAFRQIPDNNLSYPVLIIINNSSGSGFYLNYNDKNIFLITARHVLYKPSTTKLNKLPENFIVPNQIAIKLNFDKKHSTLKLNGAMTTEERQILLKLSNDQNYRNAIDELFHQSQHPILRSNTGKLLSYPHDIKEDSFNLLILDLKLLNEEKRIRFHTDKDIAAINIGHIVNIDDKSVAKFVKGANLQKRSKTGITTLDVKLTRLFNDAMIGNDIFLFGFPTSIGLRSPELGIERPLVRKGILSGKNPKLKTLIIDCPVHQGNSGSLVVEKEPAPLGNYLIKAIGIAVRYIPVFEKGVVNISESKEFVTYSNSGYSIVEPIDYILDLVKD